MVSFSLEYVLVLIATILLSLILTPLVRFLALHVGAVDQPNARRINKKPMPSSGGLAIIFAFTVSTLLLMPLILPMKEGFASYFDYMLPVVIGGLIIGVTGFIDDIYEIRAIYKMLGIVVAAILVYQFTDFHFDSFKIPFGGPLLQFDPWLTFVLTVLWIVGITNAINFLDGLDGLVSGVAIITLTTLGLVSNFFLFETDIYLTLTIFVLIAAILGFFPYNYNPAIIYLGDTGALFIGFMIAVLSLQGLKNATAVAVVSPVLILAVPIIDTGLAIIRRQLSGKKFYEPDRMHLHHRLLALGFTHRGAVLVVYGLTLLFSIASLLLNVSSRLGGILLMFGVLIGVELLVENLQILGQHRTPLMTALRFIGNSDFRQEKLAQWKQAKQQNKD